MNRVLKRWESKELLLPMSLGLAFLAAASPALAANRIIAWGDINYDVGACNNNTSSSHGPPVAQISAGNFHSVALGGDGSVLVWGDNRFGQTSVPQLLQRCCTAE